MMRRTMSAAMAALLMTAAAATAQVSDVEVGAAAEPSPKKPPPRRPPPAAKAAQPRTANPGGMAAAPVAKSLPPPNLTVLCEGKPARYAAETGVSIWVIRSGLVSAENPLRPLTPETTRVLQVVVGDRGATTYGPDLAALRRGGTPKALEATLGGAIRWDEVLTLLPDTLNLVSEANEALARLPFKECSEAPAVKPEPVRAKPKPDAKPQAKPRKPAGSDGETAGNAAPKAPKGLSLPQGALPGNP